MKFHRDLESDDGHLLLSIIRRVERIRIVKAVAGAIIGRFGFLIAVFAAFVCASASIGLPASIRYLLWGILALITGRFILALAGMIRTRDPGAVAADLESRDEALSGRIKTAVDFVRYPPPGVSASLLHHHIGNSLRLLRSARPEQLLTSSITIPWKTAGLGLITVVFLWAASGGDPLIWVGTTLPPLDPPPPPATWVSVAPGDTSVAEGSSLDITAVIEHGSGIPYLMTRFPGRTDRNEQLSTLWSKPPRTGYLKRMENINEPFRYRMAAEGDTSAWFSVDVFSPLRLTRAKTRYRYPAYTGMGEYEIPEFPKTLQAVEGTDIAVTLATNNDMIRCVVEYANDHDSDSLDVSTHGAVWPIRLIDPKRAYITAADSWGQTMRIGPVDMRPLPDLAPLILAVTPGRDVTLGKDMEIVLSIHASDDYGLSNIGITYTREGREDSLVFAEGSLGTDGIWTKQWSLDDLDLLPEDVIAYRFVVTDNNTLTGPRSSRSMWYHLRFPTLEEIIARIEGRENELVDSLHSVSEDAHSIQEELKELAVELAGDEGADWMTRESLKSLAERQQELGKRVGKIAEELASIEKQSEEAELVPAEILEKVSRVRELISELDMPELRQALTDLQEAIEKVDQKEIERSLARLSRHQDKILQSLDRATEFLEQLLAAQELSHLAREAERLAMEHETVMKSTDEQTSLERGEKEQRLSDDLGSFEEDAEETIESLERFSDAAAESLAAAVLNEKNAGTRDALRSAGESLMENRTDAARPYQEQALDALQRLAADLQSVENDLSRGDSQRMQEALTKAESVISELSVEQELINDDPELTDMTKARQVGISDALRELRTDIEELFGPGMSNASGTLLEIMADAQKQVDAAVTALHTDARHRNGKRSLSSLNSVSAAIASARNQMDNASSCPTGMPTEDMFGLSQQQSGLNSMCQSMMPRADQLSPDALSALAARQQWIRDQLARLSEESGSSGLLGDLGAIGSEMEEVVRELETQGLDRETLNTQRRILSRMLDAQRSIRRQGLARRRRSSPAEEGIMQSLPDKSDAETEPNPGMAPPPRVDDRYPPIYHALIDAYFRAIMHTDE